MTNDSMSPAAQAVYDAYCKEADNPYYYERSGLVAALRAAADQVAPLNYEDVWTDGRMLQYEKHDPVREKLLAIAAELEGSND